MLRSLSKHGQALIMMTLALFAMSGMLALAVDIGWVYFARKAARSAADSAALSAVRATLATVTTTAGLTCTATACSGGPCAKCAATPVPCSSIGDSTSNLYRGCRYAERNGFTSGGAGGRQQVLISADVTTPFNTATGPVSTAYWVTAEAVETIPSLFAALLDEPSVTIRARSTAALVQVAAPGSLILLNRERDRTVMSMPGGGDQYGVNLSVQANDTCPGGATPPCYALRTEGGIQMSSACGDPAVGTGPTWCSNGGARYYFAGENQGGGTVRSPETRIRDGGSYHLGGSADWIARPTNGTSAGFGDPLEGKTQPPVPGVASLPDIPVPGAQLNSAVCPGGVCIPGKYFATRVVRRRGVDVTEATGLPLEINGDITFGTSGFGSYVFYGGIRKGSGTVTATFQPGVYVLAGAVGGATPGAVIDTSTNFTMQDMTAGTGANTDAGALFILTNGTYSGRITPPTLLSSTLDINTLDFGTANFQAGNNGTFINLHGLNRTHASVTSNGLTDWGSLLVWWDRNNATIRHTSTGTLDLSCGGGASVNNPCTNTLSDIRSTNLRIGASAAVNLYGTIYQPRGTWTSLIGSGGYSGPLTLITGAMDVQAASRVTLLSPATPLLMTVAALIE